MHSCQPVNVLLEGVVGSTAYGLATAGSDVDSLGVFAAPTRDLFGLDVSAESVTSHDPDACWHEAAKFARLALGVNPTVYELLWLPDGGYTAVTDLGLALVELRSAFLSAGRVRDAYLGYATSQFRRLSERNDGTFGSDTRKRAAKHARHMARLLRQGRELYETGVLTVNVGEDADWFHEFSASSPEVWGRWFEVESVKFASASTALPEAPDRERVVRWLEAVRFEHLDGVAPVVFPHRGESHFGDGPFCTRCGTDWPCAAELWRASRVAGMLGA